MLGVILVVAGIVAILFANYISGEVGEGKLKIARGEQQVESGKKYFSGDPVRKEIGKGLFSPAERKIAEGKRQVGKYEEIAQLLQIGGIISIIVGGGMIIMSFIKKRRH